MLEITLYTDGACSGNPGPGGYAAVLVAKDENGAILKEREIVGGATNTTNNQMELMAVIEGLATLTKPSTVKVITDSQYIVGTMNDKWKRKKNLELWVRLDHFCQMHTVAFIWVKGHAGHEYNERCDQLAVKQCEIYATQPPDNSPDILNKLL